MYVYLGEVMKPPLATYGCTYVTLNVRRCLVWYC